jgi:hypothetical protein
MCVSNTLLTCKFEVHTSHTLIAPSHATMQDIYGSNLPPVLHTRLPMCLPAPVPPLTALDTRELISIFVPSLLFLLILPWLIVHLPREARPPSRSAYAQPVPAPQEGYVIYSWGGEETPIFWKTPVVVQYPQPTQSNEMPKTDSNAESAPSIVKEE